MRCPSLAVAASTALSGLLVSLAPAQTLPGPRAGAVLDTRGLAPGLQARAALVPAGPAAAPAAGGCSASRAGAARARAAPARAASAASGGALGSAGSSRGSAATRGASGRGAGPRGGACSAAGATSGHGPAPRDHWTRWWARNGDEFLWSDTAEHRPATTSATSALTGRGHRPPVERRPSRATLYTGLVPELLELLEGSDDPGVLDAATIALARTVEQPFDGAVLESLTPLLGHRHLGVQTTTALALGLLGSEDGVGPLLDLATCSVAGHRLVDAAEVPLPVRCSAVLALGFLDHRDAVGPLVDLVERLPDAEREIKSCAIAALGLMDNEDTDLAVAYLTSKLRDRRLDPDIRSVIPTALGHLGRPASVDALLGVLEDRDSDRLVRQSAVIGLGRLAPIERQDVVDALVERVRDDRDAPTRHFALVSLGRIGGRDARPAANAARHGALARVLGRELTRPRRSADRPWAALAAGIHARTQTGARSLLVDRLLAAYDDVADPETKGAFALGLGLARAHEGRARLREDFEDVHDWGFRGHAAVALGLLDDDRAAPLLRSSIVGRGVPASARTALALGLGLMDDRAAPALLGDGFAAARTLETRTGLASALGALRCGDSLPVLATAVGDAGLDPASRASACAALGFVSEKTTLPWHARLSIDSNFMADFDTLAVLLPES